MGIDEKINNFRKKAIFTFSFEQIVEIRNFITTLFESNLITIITKQAKTR